MQSAIALILNDMMMSAGSSIAAMIVATGDEQVTCLLMLLSFKKHPPVNSAHRRLAMPARGGYILLSSGANKLVEGQ